MNSFGKLYLTYGFYGIAKLLFYIILTKVFFRKARIIRFPIEIRGRRFISISEGLTTGKYCRIEACPKDFTTRTLFIGKNVQINDSVHITAMGKVLIGDNVLMASKIYISDCSHGTYSGNAEHSNPKISPMKREYSIKPVIIGDNVWIGESVSILPGVTIGKGSIIGANSVVSKNIPEFTIAVGAPAHPIKKYNFDTKKWEKYNFLK